MGNELFSSESTLNYRRRILELDNLVDNDYDYEYLFEDEFYELYDITFEGFKKIYFGKTASDNEKFGGIYYKDQYVLNKLNDITVNHLSKNRPAYNENENTEGISHKDEDAFWKSYYRLLKNNEELLINTNSFSVFLHERIKNMIQKADNELSSEQKRYLAKSCDFPKKGGSKKDCVFKNKSCVSKESCEFRKEGCYLEPYSSTAISHWISPGEGAKRNISKREYIFQMSFALDLPLAKFDEYIEDGKGSNEKGYPVHTHQGFCHKVLNQKYCINSPDELCMMYCKHFGLGYTDALKLYVDFIKKSEEISENENSETKADASSAKTKLNKKEEAKENTRSNLDNLVFNLDKRDDNAFLQSLVEYSEKIKPDFKEIKEYINGKIETIFEKESVRITFMEKIYNAYAEDFHKILKEKKLSNPNIDKYNSGFFCSEDDSEQNGGFEDSRLFFDYIYPGNEIVNIPKTQIDFLWDLCVDVIEPNSRLNPTRTYYERCRKSIIIVNFFEYGVNALIGEISSSDKDTYRSNSKNFIQELNETLTSFNMPTLYPYDKFDQLIMWCSKTKEPLKMYYETILKVQEKLLLRLKENFQN